MRGNLMEAGFQRVFDGSVRDDCPGHPDCEGRPFEVCWPDAEDV